MTKIKYITKELNKPSILAVQTLNDIIYLSIKKDLSNRDNQTKKA